MHIVTPDWRNRLDEDVLTGDALVTQYVRLMVLDMCKRRKYRWNSVMDLMRAIRNKVFAWAGIVRNVFSEAPLPRTAEACEETNGCTPQWLLQLLRGSFSSPTVTCLSDGV